MTNLTSTQSSHAFACLLEDPVDNGGGTKKQSQYGW